MKTFVLIMMLTSDRGHAIGTAEFSSQAACVVAQEAFVAQARRHAKALSSPGRPMVAAVCVEK